MIATGKVVHVEEQSGTSKAERAWRKKIFVIEYPNGMSVDHLAFELFGGQAIDANPFKKNQYVKVVFRLNSTEWNGRWFTQCSASQVYVVDKKAEQGINSIDTPDYIQAVPEQALNPQPVEDSVFNAFDDNSALPF